MDHPPRLTPPRDVLAPPPNSNGCPSYPESAGYSSGYSGGYVDDPESYGLLDYWRILRRRKGTLLLVGFLGLLSGLLVSVSQTPVYQARAALEIQDLNDNFLNTKQVNPLSEGPGSTVLSDIQTQIKLLQSESLLKRVLAKLQDRTSGASVNVTDPGRGGTPLGSTSRIAPWRKAFNLAERQPSYGINPVQAARNLKVRAAGQTRIVELLYDSTDRHFAADFANTLGQEFIDSNMEARWKMSQHTGEWLSHQLEDMRIKLERSEGALQSYARRTGLMFTTERFTSEKTNIAEYKLRQLQEDLTKAQSDRISTQARWEMTKTSSVDGLPDVPNDSSLRALQDKMTELRRERAELITTYTEKHSKVQRVEAQIAPLETALQKERSAIVDRLRSDYDAALRRESLLDTNFANQSRLVTDQAEKSIQYNILKRELDSNRQLYEAMLQRVKESSIASAIRASNVRIVDPAEPPALPYRPNLPMNATLGLLSGLFLGVAFVMMSARADSSLQNPGDAQAWINVPELAVIPSAAKEERSPLRLYLSNKRNSVDKSRALSLTKGAAIASTSNADTPAISVAASNGGGKRETGCVELTSWQRQPGPVAESIRSLLASILLSWENGSRPRVLVVTSASPKEGKTTIASNLGIAFAAIHHRVLIIDGDLRKPRMHEVFGVRNEHGLATLLERSPVDAAVPDTVLRKTSIPGLFVLPSGAADQNTMNEFHGTKLTEALSRLKREFDMVIIDTPPMLQMPDARMLGRLADGVILVTRAGHTTKDAAIAANQCFVRDKTKVLGTILNDWNPKSSASWYYR